MYSGRWAAGKTRGNATPLYIESSFISVDELAKTCRKILDVVFFSAFTSLHPPFPFHAIDCFYPYNIITDGVGCVECACAGAYFVGFRQCIAVHLGLNVPECARMCLNVPLLCV